MPWPEEPRDPALHLLVWRDFQRQPDGSAVMAAVTLTDAGRTLTEAVARARPVDSFVNSAADPLADLPSDTLSLSRGQATAIATMFRDFAQRVLPGTAVGPLRTDDALSAIAEECASRMRQHTMQFQFTAPHVAADPPRHFLTKARYIPSGGGRHEALPLELDAPVAEWRAEIAAGRGHEPNVTYFYPNIISLSLARVQVIAELLHEYAARMRPGREVGPVQSSGELSRLLDELATDLRTRDA
ncbi:hypothetical protein ACFPIJ_32530 [Dactylosporangium cerinum]|uniref:Condensation domain-containing protein n=1 Tax=Dactylosporangium cerinum TaxID=1434730 RepID=A0ABV9W1U1_9ACTN